MERTGNRRRFRELAPNAVLIRFAQEELRRCGAGRALDIGCGAGRNAVPLARVGWEIVGIDLSPQMLVAAAERASDAKLDEQLQWLLAPMDAIPVADRSFDLVIAAPQPREGSNRG